jgi:hypothetical protein
MDFLLEFAGKLGIDTETEIGEMEEYEQRRKGNL